MSKSMIGEKVRIFMSQTNKTSGKLEYRELDIIIKDRIKYKDHVNYVGKDLDTGEAVIVSVKQIMAFLSTVGIILLLLFGFASCQNEDTAYFQLRMFKPTQANDVTIDWLEVEKNELVDGKVLDQYDSISSVRYGNPIYFSAELWMDDDTIWIAEYSYFDTLALCRINYSVEDTTAQAAGQKLLRGLEYIFD